MDTDQILKRVQWMDDERRKDKDAIALLENRILSLEGSLSAANQQVKELSGEITRLTTIITRMDKYDEALLQMRVEQKRTLEDIDKETRKREEEAEKVRRLEMRALDNSVLEMHKELEPISRLEKNILVRVDEEARLGRMVDELRSRIEAMRRSEDDYTRTYRLLEEGRRQDTKKINDIQGEASALRKRADDQRAQVELVNNSLRKLETRLSELLQVETERRDAMTGFLDKQNLLQVERDRTWKEWAARFETIEKQTVDIEAQLQKLEVTHREARRVQGVLEELTQKVDRRISEITEIQRLAEDRFRQEWVTFKADDQKRWTNYTLSQEEHRSEIARSGDKIADRVTSLEDSIQEQRDLLQQVNEQEEQQLQSLLSLVHDWVASYERTLGRVR